MCALQLWRGHADLVFIQNGMLQPWLDEQGLGSNTQVISVSPGTLCNAVQERRLLNQQSGIVS